MSRPAVFSAAFLFLAACAQQGTPTVTSNLQFTDSTTDIVVGQRAVFQVALVAGDMMVESVGVAEYRGLSWSTDVDGSTDHAHSVKAPPGFKVGSTCAFVRVDVHGMPVLPLQAIAVDGISPCFPPSEMGMQNLTGKVAEFRDIKLCFDEATATIKAPVLTDVSFDRTATEKNSKPIDMPLQLSPSAVDAALERSSSAVTDAASDSSSCS